MNSALPSSDPSAVASVASYSRVCKSEGSLAGEDEALGVGVLTQPKDSGEGSGVQEQNPVAVSCYTEHGNHMLPVIVFTVGTVLVLLSVVCGLMIYATTTEPENYQFNVLKCVSAGAGSLVLGLVFFCSLGWARRSARGVEVNAEGVEYVTARKVRKVAWEEIDRLVLQPGFITKGDTPYTIAKILPCKGREIAFYTNWDGEPFDVLGKLETRLDYIVRNPCEYEGNTR